MIQKSKLIFFLLIFSSSFLFSNDNSQYYNVLLDINKISSIELSEIPHFDNNKIDLFINYRNDKQIEDLYELTNIGFNNVEIENLKNFLYVDKKKKHLFTSISYNFNFKEINEISNQQFSNNYITNNDSIALRIYNDNIKILYFAKGRNLFNNDYSEYISNNNLSFSFINDNLQILLGLYSVNFGNGLLIGKNISSSSTLKPYLPPLKKNKNSLAIINSTYNIDSSKNINGFRGASLSFFNYNLNINNYFIELRNDIFISYYESNNNLNNNEQLDFGINNYFIIPYIAYNNGLIITYHLNKLKNINNYGLSYYFDSYYFYPLNIFGEIVYFNGINSELGISYLRDENLKFTILGFYKDTNYNAPFGKTSTGRIKDLYGLMTSFEFTFLNNIINIYGSYNYDIEQTNNYLVGLLYNLKGEMFNLDFAFLNNIFYRYGKYNNLTSNNDLKVNLIKKYIDFNIKHQLNINFLKKEMANIIFTSLNLKNLSIYNIILGYSYTRSASFETPAEIDLNNTGYSFFDYEGIIDRLFLNIEVDIMKSLIASLNVSLVNKYKNEDFFIKTLEYNLKFKINL